MRKCLIHIGVDKTGSTSIQKTLSLSRASLRAVGIEYPQRPHYSLVNELSANLPAKKYAGGLSLGDLKELNRSRDFEYLIVSSESLSNSLFDAPSIYRFLDCIVDIGFSVTVIAFVRPQAGYINSVYAQGMKSLSHDLVFERYVDRFWKSDHYAFMRRLAGWSGHSRSHFVAAPYKAGRLNTELARSMLIMGGIPPDRIPSSIFIQSPFSNPSLGPKAIAACRYAYSALKRHAATELPARMDGLILGETQRRGWNEIPFSGFSDESASEFESRFSEENEKFSQIYWNARWSDLFSDQIGRAWTKNEISIDVISSEDRCEFEDFVDSLKIGINRLRQI